MELRAVARRCPSRSMTILGDLAQATAPAAQESWEDAVVHLGSPSTARIEELELGYRVPKPILDVANGLLPLVAPGVRPSQSVRPDGSPPRVVHADAAGLAEAVVAAVQDHVRMWSSVGVVVPTILIDRVEAALRVAGVAFGDGQRGGLTEAVTVLLPPEAKGLEFDAVIVVEPARFLLDGEAGGRLLYIALTRAVQELSIVHSEPLPGALAS